MPPHPQAALAIQRAGDLPTDLSPAELRLVYERQRLAEFDPLVDENEAYAKRLKEADVRCDYVCFAGMIHPFFTLGGIVEDSAEAEGLIAAALRRLT
jgi:hypothetical protein